MIEDNAKALLKQVYARMDIVQDGKGEYKPEYKSEQYVTDLILSFIGLVRFTKGKKEK